jgi:hypothetical protein
LDRFGRARYQPITAAAGANYRDGQRIAGKVNGGSRR